MKITVYVCCLFISIMPTEGQVAKEPKPPFQITISAPPPPIKVGTPILIHIVLKSLSEKQIIVPETRHDGTQGEYNYRINVTKNKGIAPEDTDHGRKRKNGTEVLGSISMILKYLNQGDEITEDADLNYVVKIRESGDYAVQVERFDEAYATLHIKSNILTLHITAP